LNKAESILGTYLQVKDAGRTAAVPVSGSFWEELAGGGYPHLDQGRLMSAFTFSEPWSTWERHPAGEELVLLLSGVATVALPIERDDACILAVRGSEGLACYLPGDKGPAFMRLLERTFGTDITTRTPDTVGKCLRS
jgi:hypothetical protein